MPVLSRISKKHLIRGSLGHSCADTEYQKPTYARAHRSVPLFYGHPDIPRDILFYDFPRSRS